MTDQPDSLGVHISPREIYDQIVGMREDVRGLTQTSESVRAELADHEDRLRQIERWRYAVPATVVMGLGSAVAEAIRIASK
ncbi:hypothetical protein [Streptomyces sp. CB03911]|uniref:hypothetical protein n=1 Tax=Streptomyces sp. CB03911 TaxID=1804758 RepID=UPI00093BEAEC|nr:hypothetical protein [Streptomyces sp. CB03911]OKI24408.1 hypothetical protein A6A07_05980 [Streptomyces sp. CB03911]